MTTINVTADELRAFIERIEQMNAEIADLTADRKEVFTEAKGRGYSTKAIRHIVTIRKRRAEELAEEEAIIELYLSAIGMKK